MGNTIKSFDLQIPPKSTVFIQKKRRFTNSNHLKSIVNEEQLKQVGVQTQIKMKGNIGLSGRFDLKKKVFKNEPKSPSPSGMM